MLSLPNIVQLVKGKNMNRETILLDETEAKKTWDSIFPEIYNLSINVFNKHLPSHKLSFNKQDNLIVDETTGITLGPKIVCRETIAKTKECPGFELFVTVLVSGHPFEPDDMDVLELGEFLGYRDAVRVFAEKVFEEELRATFDTNY